VEEFKTEGAAEVSAASPRWTGAPAIELAHQLNEQCVELVCELAATSTDQEPPPFVLRNRDLCRLLDPEARRRVAAIPFVIVDIRFKDADWWQRAGDGHWMSPTNATVSSGIPPKLCEDLALETLLFARQAAREDINVAKAMFAMTSPVARRMASLTLQQVRTIALGSTQHLRVRWDGDPEFWRDLLIACRTGDEQAMAAMRRQAKLLFCGEFVPTPR